MLKKYHCTVNGEIFFFLHQCILNQNKFNKEEVIPLKLNQFRPEHKYEQYVSVSHSAECLRSHA